MEKILAAVIVLHRAGEIRAVTMNSTMKLTPISPTNTIASTLDPNVERVASANNASEKNANIPTANIPEFTIGQTTDASSELIQEYLQSLFMNL